MPKIKDKVQELELLSKDKDKIKKESAGIPRHTQHSEKMISTDYTQRRLPF